MNKLQGKVTATQTEGNLTLVDIDCQGTPLKTIVIETQDTCDYLEKNTDVEVLFKETEVSISTERLTSISLRNQIPCQITRMVKGKILSQIDLVFGNAQLKSIITTQAVLDLELKIGQQVYSLIKTNELMINKPK